MSDTYDKYVAVRGIAKSIIVNSDGIKHNGFDLHKIIEDVYRANDVNEIANRYWRAMKYESECADRLRAAKTLKLDESEYKEAYDTAVESKQLAIADMDAILDSDEFYNSPYVGWKRKSN